MSVIELRKIRQLAFTESISEYHISRVERRETQIIGGTESGKGRTVLDKHGRPHLK